MEDLIDYSADPSGEVPIWTHPGTSAEEFFSFDHEFSEGVEALPAIS